MRLQSNCSSAYTDRQQLLMNSDFILRFRASLECLCSLLLQVCKQTNKQVTIKQIKKKGKGKRREFLSLLIYVWSWLRQNSTFWVVFNIWSSTTSSELHSNYDREVSEPCWESAWINSLFRAPLQECRTKLFWDKFNIISKALYH